MKLPIFHRYFSINTLIYLAILEFLFLIPIFLHIIFASMLLFIFPDRVLDYLFLFTLVFLYVAHYYVMPFFALLIPIEFYLRKKGKLVKAHIVNIPLKYLKYIYIFTALIYIAIIIVTIIIGQPMTEEEMMFD